MGDKRIIQPGEILPPSQDAPFVRLPERKSLFAARAVRLSGLSHGHSMAPFLQFAAALMQVQQELLDAFPAVPLPNSDQVERCREHGMPPVSPDGWARDPAWRGAFASFLQRLQAGDNVQLASAFQHLQAQPVEALEKMANAMLAGQYSVVDSRLAPFIGAALQVYWSHMVTTLGAAVFSRTATPTVCPACGSPPTGSIVHSGGIAHGMRYLHCSLCATAWHMVRIKCSHCEATEGVNYFGLEAIFPATKAESCDTCNTYLKIHYQEKDIQVEACADDLATLALDLLMDESGKFRSGPNLLLAPGVSG